MTEKDTNPFADLLEQSTPAAAQAPAPPQAPAEIDFSFLDQPTVVPQAAAAPAQAGGGAVAAGSDLSFLETLIPTKPETPVQPSAQVMDTSAFSFDDDESREEGVAPVSAAMPSGQQPEGNGTAEREPQPMVFACLKCAAKVTVAFPETAVARLEQACPSCAAKVVVVRESSAQRASRKTGDIYCAGCSRIQGPQLHCCGCGRFCPDYYLVEDPKEAQRKAKEARSNNFKLAMANLRAAFTRRHDKHEELHHEAAHHGAGVGALLKNRKVLYALAAAVALLLIGGISAFMYVKHKQEQQYIVNYVKAVYALHAGMEDIKAGMAKTAREWQAATEGGRMYTPKPDSDTSIKLAKTVTASAKLMQQLQQKTPKKYEQPHARLMAFQAQFNATQTAFMNPPASFTLFSRQIEDADAAIKQKSQELKAALPQELAAELDEARKRYRGFAGF